MWWLCPHAPGVFGAMTRVFDGEKIHRRVEHGPASPRRRPDYPLGRQLSGRARLHLTKRIPEYHDLLTCSTARQSSEEPAFGLVHNDPGNP